MDSNYKQIQISKGFEKTTLICCQKGNIYFFRFNKLCTETVFDHRAGMSYFKKAFLIQF